ncbi:hypothetical protein AMJ85_08560 [candidate division BRC1 bacterium SM23_51]|nr:MAG: hypothetical protein AMJ85_08560 [candidate division BRC1 bacterium SM23_51]
MASSALSRAARSRHASVENEVARSKRNRHPSRPSGRGDSRTVCPRCRRTAASKAPGVAFSAVSTTISSDTSWSATVEPSARKKQWLDGDANAGCTVRSSIQPMSQPNPHGCRCCLAACWPIFLPTPDRLGNSPRVKFPCASRLCPQEENRQSLLAGERWRSMGHCRQWIA